MPIRIEVLNGTGHAGLANKVASELRRRGIDVFRVENADHFDYVETILIKRRRGTDAEALAEQLRDPLQACGVGVEIAATLSGIDPVIEALSTRDELFSSAPVAPVPQWSAVVISDAHPKPAGDFTLPKVSLRQMAAGQ